MWILLNMLPEAAAVFDKGTACVETVEFADSCMVGCAPHAPRTEAAPHATQGQYLRAVLVGEIKASCDRARTELSDAAHAFPSSEQRSAYTRAHGSMGRT